jgi:hypothetical protein
MGVKGYFIINLDFDTIHVLTTPKAELIGSEAMQN